MFLYIERPAGWSCRDGENKISREKSWISSERRSWTKNTIFGSWLHQRLLGSASQKEPMLNELLGSGTARNTCSNEHHTYVFQKRRPTNKAFEKSENCKEKLYFPGGVRAYVSQRKGETDFARQPAFRLWRPMGPLTSVPLSVLLWIPKAEEIHFSHFSLKGTSN